jgi:RND family efflux transporter MFP subunit
MDLNRLKIPEKETYAQRGRMGLVVIGLVCLVAGYFARVGQERLLSAKAISVKTEVVRSGSSRQEGDSFTASGWVEAAWPQYPLTISSRLAERVEEVLVKEGEMVQPGQGLVRLYDRDLKARLEMSRAQLAEAEKNQEKLSAGYRKQEIDSLRAKANQAAEAFRLAKANYERTKNLTLSVVSAQELDTALSEMKKAEAAHASTAADLRNAEAGFRREDIDAAQAKVKAMQAQVALDENNFSYCTVTAPADKPPLRVLKVFHSVGDWISEKEVRDLVSLYDPKEMEVRVDITQASIGKARLGGKARIATDANPNHPYTGSIARIEPLAELAKNTITVRVRIDNPDDMLYPSMIARATILQGGDSATSGTATIYAAPREAVLGAGADRYVFVADGGVARKRAVSVGAERDGRIEIVSGLTSGQRIITGPMDKITEGQAVEETE